LVHPPFFFLFSRLLFGKWSIVCGVAHVAKFATSRIVAPPFLFGLVLLSFASGVGQLVSAWAVHAKLLPLFGLFSCFIEYSCGFSTRLALSSALCGVGHEV
jgi:hypothetical protein